MNSVPDDLIRRFTRGETDPAETAALVREALLAGPDEVEPSALPAIYAAALGRALVTAADHDRQAAAERERVETLWRELEVLVEPLALVAIAENPRFAAWEVVEALREASFAAGPEDPLRARRLARYAVAAARAIPPGPEGAALAADLLCLTWAQLGNAERIATDLRAADAALAAADGHLARGTGDPLVRARLLSLLASLRSDQWRFNEAVELARKAARLYRRAGDRHGVGRTLLKLATFHSYRDEVDEALEQLDEAIGHLDPRAEPRLAFAARHNRASTLERAGRLEEAAEALAAAAPLARAAVDRVRLLWLEGRIAVAREDFEAGEEAMLAAQAAFIELGLGYETAQVSLELAALYAEQDRTADQRRLAEEMVPLFAARDVHPEARAALALFCDAARREAATVAFAREVAAYLEVARERPMLAFREQG